MKKRNKKKQPIINNSIVYEQLQLEAIEGVLTNSFAFFERKVRRWYSKTFATPLHETYRLPWDEILLNYYEDAVTGRDYNEVYEAAIGYVPELQKEREIEDDRLTEYLEAEQARSLAKKEAKANKHKKGTQHTESESNRSGDSKERDKISVSEGEEKGQSLKDKPQEMNLNFEDNDNDDDDL